MDYQTAFCGFGESTSQLIRQAGSCVANARYRYHFDRLQTLRRVDIAVINLDRADTRRALDQLHQRQPTAVPICVSTDGLSGDSCYRVQTRSLLAELPGMLDEVVSTQLRHAPRGESERLRNTQPSDLAQSSKRAWLAAKAPRSLPAANCAAFGPQEQPLSVLIVDDSPVIRLYLCGILQCAGMRCSEAADASQALALLRDQSFDIAVLDVVMPGIDGFELCQIIKHDPQYQAMPTVMLSGQISDLDCARGALAGCDAYLSKPVAGKTLISTINRLVKEAPVQVATQRRQSRRMPIGAIAHRK